MTGAELRDDFVTSGTKNVISLCSSNPVFHFMNVTLQRGDREPEAEAEAEPEPESLLSADLMFCTVSC